MGIPRLRHNRKHTLRLCSVNRGFFTSNTFNLNMFQVAVIA